MGRSATGVEGKYIYIVEISALQENVKNVSRDRYNHTININVKVKVSRDRPGVARSVPGGLGSQIFITFGT